MTFQEYLEEDRERFTQALIKAESPERAVAVVEAEYDRLLLRYNDGCGDSGLREQAAMMIQAARAGAIVDCVGEIRVWERSAQTAEAEQKRRRSFGTAGFGCIAVSVIGSILLHPLGVGISAVIPGVFCAASGVLLYLAGRSAGQGGGTNRILRLLRLPGSKNPALPAPGASEEVLPDGSVRRLEKLVDPARIYRSVHTALLIVDRNLEEAASRARWTESGSGDFAQDTDEQELTVFADLLEAVYSGDGQFALDRLKSLKYYLHRRGIETADYREETREYFDRMPSADGQVLTIRPALLKDGKLLKKGLAAG